MIDLTLNIDIDISVEMLDMLIDGTKYPFINPIKEYLSQRNDLRAINKDQWCSILEFCKSMDKDLSGYDEAGSCKICLIILLLRKKLFTLN